MPEISQFGLGKASHHSGATGAAGATWFDVDMADDADRQWLMGLQEINDQTRQALLAPVRFNHYEQVPDGTLVSIRTPRSEQIEDISELADLKLLIGPARAMTVRSGPIAAVEVLRRHRSDSSLVTAVDLLGFMVSAMTKRMEAVIFDLTQDIDAVEDALLDGGTAPPPQALSELRRRIFRTRRQVNATQQVLAPMTTDPALVLDADDRETLVRSSNYVTRYLQGLDECRTRVQLLEDQIDAQRSETMTRSSLNLTIVATVFLPLTFITGLLGMNVAGIPDQHNPFGFWTVTGLSVLVALLAWVLLRREIHDRQLDQASRPKKTLAQEPKTLSPENVELTLPPRPSAETGHQDKSDQTAVEGHHPGFRRKIVRIYGFALLLALALFFFHLVMIFDVAGAIIGQKAWMLEHFGHHTGKTLILGCFFLLFAAHLAESAAWGFFLRGTRLLPSLTEGVYFAAASITTLGFGDVLLKYPWRHIGPLIAISGVLMFGCSTAFLFVIMQDVWVGHL
ncbi:CorA family divalent cation transporter [Thiorhodovibrio frisius]|uniref:Mg2+/Co2+ transporter n=1 Tax=Thiorhodovibrio frisius TaxID=631362 RepID=H8Z6Q3_9GAMM|nr:CorA family divalent cation transporter [Thiorhodovibrio frisius]EIC20769.1 Mg2+/Co2+ transporter [Thiorhodovibrio frisius]WPL21517.1 Zinc transport protein ZntB [Thiorhodovibrio frisius]